VVRRVAGDAVLVRARLARHCEGGDAGRAASADDLSHGGPCIVTGIVLVRWAGVEAVKGEG
jgi:hypothetical protein